MAVETTTGTADGDDPDGVGTAQAVAHVVEQVRRRGLRDVVLVPHSWTGFPATAAAHHLADVVRAVVCFSAVVPQRGVSVNEELPPELAAHVRETLAASGASSVPMTFEQFAGTLMRGEPEGSQRLVFDMLTPTPLGYVLEGVDVDPVTSAGIPAAYVLAEDDRALVEPGRELAARIGLEPTMVPGSHEAMLTHPDEVARALVAAVAALDG